MSASTRVAIIVVGFNSGRHVEGLLASLRAGVHPYTPTLCLLDNGSEDDTADLFRAHARSWPHEVVLHRSGENLGYTGGNNLALQLLSARAEFDFYVLLNPDTAVRSEWLAGLLKPFPEARVGTAASVLLLPDGRVDARGCGLHFLGFGFTLGYGRPLEALLTETPSYASGAAMAISRACLESVQALSGEGGLFWPELYLYHDDLELGWRVLLAGYRPSLAQESQAVHHHQFAGGPSNPRKFFFMERNRFLVLVCHYKWPTLLLLSPLLLLVELALLATDRRLGPWGRLRVYQAVLRSLRSPLFWKRRRRIQAARVRSDAEVLAFMRPRIDHPEMQGARAALNGVSALAFALLRRLVRW